MKEKKPIELMPPPRAPIRTTKDIIQELRKNLRETQANIIQNQQLKEELNKIKLMNKENSFNYSFLSLNNLPSSNTNINNNESDNLLTDLETHNFHNELNLDEDNLLNTSIDTGKDKESFVKFNKLPSPKKYSEKFDDIFNKIIMANNQRKSVNNNEKNGNNISNPQSEKTTDSFKKKQINVSFIDNN